MVFDLRPDDRRHLVFLLGSNAFLDVLGQQEATDSISVPKAPEHTPACTHTSDLPGHGGTQVHQEI